MSGVGHSIAAVLTLRSALERVSHERDDLRATLEWYADAQNWIRDDAHDGYYSPDAYDDKGERARRALERSST